MNNKNKKTAAKYVLDRLDNPILCNCGRQLMDDNPIMFNSFIRDLFGTKIGDRILYKINANGIVNDPQRVASRDLYQPKKITWEEFDNSQLIFEHYIDDYCELNMEKKTDPLHALYDTLGLFIDNEMIDEVYIQLEARSYYFSKSLAIQLNADLLHKVRNIKDLYEVIFNHVCNEIKNMAKSIADFVDETPLPEIIKKDMQRLHDGLEKNDRSYCYKGLSQWLACRACAIIALILSTESGVAHHESCYVPEYKTSHLDYIGPSSMQIGVHLVSVNYIDGSDDGAKTSEYRTSYPQMSNADHDLMTELVNSLNRTNNEPSLTIEPTDEIAFAEKSVVKYKNADGYHIGIISKINSNGIVEISRFPTGTNEFLNEGTSFVEKYDINAFVGMIVTTYPLHSFIFNNLVEVNVSAAETSVSLVLAPSQQKIVDNIINCINATDYASAATDILCVMHTEEIDGFIIFQNNAANDIAIYKHAGSNGFDIVEGDELLYTFNERN